MCNYVSTVCTAVCDESQGVGVTDSDTHITHCVKSDTVSLSPDHHHARATHARLYRTLVAMTLYKDRAPRSRERRPVRPGFFVYTSVLSLPRRGPWRDRSFRGTCVQAEVLPLFICGEFDPCDAQSERAVPVR